MSLLRRVLLGVAALVGASHLLSASLSAQPIPNLPASTRSNSIAARAVGSERPPTPTAVPPLPLTPSPISFFRELLAMSPTQRTRVLTNRPPESRMQILAKVREYESLKPDERELRLHVTELRWYLRPLMTMPATNRPAQLALIPEEHRRLIEDRLQEWDKVSPEVQQELLGLEPTLQVIIELEGRSGQQRQELIASVPPARREMLEKGIQQWNSMSEAQRQQALSRFGQFFQLTAREKERAISTLSEPERRQIEKTLQTFGRMPADQRAQCMRSFAKFAGLSLAERQQFLENAERWKLMSPADRQAWRAVVTRLPPPLPPRRPPLPPSIRPGLPTPSVATNRN